MLFDVDWEQVCGQIPHYSDNYSVSMCNSSDNDTEGSALGH